MIIRSKKSWKDSVDQKPHKGVSRRDFLRNGLVTGVATVGLPHALMAGFAKSAFASQSSCPPQVRTAGALAQIYRDGGPTVGAMFINQTQAGFMNANAASRYGIVQADLVQVGANYYLAKSSPFAMALMTPPPGYSQAQWNTVLSKTSLGGHYGAFNQDDGAGENSGLMGGASSFKSSVLGKDLRINNSATLAAWAQGIPSTGVQGNSTQLTAANIAKNFGISPAANINAQLMTNAAVASESLSQIFMNLFAGGRTAGAATVSKAVCGFYGDSAMADPTFGNSLFNPTQVSALSSAITLGTLSNEEQALLASFYQSATGTVGGVFIQQNGNDYHGQSVQNNISPSDYEAGRMFAMFLAACDVAKSKGSMISLHNGQAIAAGTQAATINGTGGTQVNVMGPVASGDAGGAYNAGFILCYDPSSAPKLEVTGTFNTTSGDVTAASAVGASNTAVAGLYLTALTHLGFNVASAQAAMATAGISVTSSLMLI